MLKVLYLDYDGVIHDSEVFVHRKHGIYIRKQGRTLFEWMPILEELLQPHPDVKIVLSTSWVRSLKFNNAKKKLSLTLQERVIGATFHHRFMRKDDFSYLPRGVQITADVSRRMPISWFAIDDEVEGWPEWCRDKLIKTDGALGISCSDVQNAIREMLIRL